MLKRRHEENPFFFLVDKLMFWSKIWMFSHGFSARKHRAQVPFLKMIIDTKNIFKKV